MTASVYNDPRMQRTRGALQGALTTLLMQRRYTEIRVEDLLRASGVGRTTFYENYRNKDALLVSCMEQMTSTLSCVPFDEDSLVFLTPLLEHLFLLRSRLRGLLQGTPLRKVRQDLVTRIEVLLLDRAAATAIPARLVAFALADVVLSPILAWLSGEGWCSPTDLACGIRSSSKAIVDSICCPSQT